jgi:asparagine synthase (glutamine-hydrolysing)
MCAGDGRYWIVYNGEIYNYLELKEELVREGYTFQSRSDTEVLLNGYSHWGFGVLNRLVGMFAFAIYDRQEELLFLARDFFGIKPLYYTIWPGGFAFASEIKALLTLPHVSRTVNPQRAYEYLRLGFIDHGGETLISEIQQLPAAHCLRLTLEKSAFPRPARFWDIDLTVKSDLSFDDAASRVRDMFLKNVELHLRSDVPVGAALSGGIDSSAIVMAMREVQGSSLDLNTFSFVADDSDVNEEKWVDMVGRTAGASVFKVRLTQEQLLSDLDQLIYFQDEPFTGTSIYAQYRVMRLAKENGIKVLLDGQGADEMLGGYRPYLDARLASLLRQVQWLKACRFLLSLRQYDDYRLRTILMRTGSYFLPPSLRASLLKLIGMDLIPPWLKERWFKEHEVKIEPSARSFSREILREEMYRSLMRQLLVVLLRYEDRNSMAFSIESRVPFLTPELATFLSSLPEDYIIDLNGTSKSVFRQAMKGIVPDEILERKDKIGFATPEEMWLRNLRPWVESILRSDAAKRIVFFDVAAMERGWLDLLHGRKEFDFTAWRWINFIRWAEQRDISFDS